MYAKLTEGVLQYAPTTYKLKDGRTISNFNKSVTLMRRNGFKEVVERRPNFDSETQYLVINEYLDEDENIVITYTVKEIEIVEPQKSLEEQIEEIKQELEESKQQNDMLLECVLEMSELVYGG